MEQGTSIGAGTVRDETDAAWFTVCGYFVLLLSDTRVRIAYDSPANIQTSGGTGPMLRHLSLKKIAARKLRVLMSVVALLIFVTMLEVARSP